MSVFSTTPQVFPPIPATSMILGVLPGALHPDLTVTNSAVGGASGVGFVASRGVEPSKLARELDVQPKALRAWLRRTFPRDEVSRGRRWLLTPGQVEAVRKHFGGVKRVVPRSTASND